MPFLPRNPEHHTADVVALHRATLENPLDDTPHLVYADAMDDAGAHEEAHTLRRLVKLRAAIGTKIPTPPRSGKPVTAYKDKLPVTNVAANPDPDRQRHETGPHIRLPDIKTAELPAAGDRNRRASWEHDRYLRFVPETGGAMIGARQRVANYHRRLRTPYNAYEYGPTRAFIHSDTVKHLLGETDAQ